jgi:hypothetical protein
VKFEFQSNCLQHKGGGSFLKLCLEILSQHLNGVHPDNDSNSGCLIVLHPVDKHTLTNLELNLEEEPYPLDEN